MKKLQLKKKAFFMPYVICIIIVVLITIWLLPVKAQTSYNKREMAYFNNIFSSLIEENQSAGKTDIEYYTGDFYPEIKGKVKSINGGLPKNFLLLFPELRIIN